MKIKYSASFNYENELNDTFAKLFNWEEVLTRYFKTKLNEDVDGPDKVEITDVKFSMEDDK